MKGINNRASIFIFILLLINIIFVLAIVVFNNSFVVNSDINIGKYSEEVFSNIYNKGNISINSVIKYNTNGNGFMDGISCPTNVTMSGSTSSGTNISTHMILNIGSFYCSGDYAGEEFRIYYDEEFSDFTKAYFKGDIINIGKTASTNIGIGTNNIASSSDVYGTSDYLGRSLTNLRDGDTSTLEYGSSHSIYPYVGFKFSSNKSVGLIKIYNDLNPTYWGINKDWDDGEIILYNQFGFIITSVYINDVLGKDLIEVNLKYRGLTDDVRRVVLAVNGFGYLDLREVEIYELESIGSEEIWIGDRPFNDSDSTLLSFTSEGIGGADGLDDDFNSDNYRVTSIGDTYYPNGFADDDVIPRKIIFGNINPGVTYSNIFWNNYKTNDFIDQNSNNDDIINVKIGNVEQAYVHLDLYNLDENLYDFKILEFDKDSYKNKFTLLPLKTTKGINITDYLGYIQNNAGVLSLSKNKTGNEYIFDFKNKDYGIFISNKSDGNLTYRISAETTTGTGIYINPIDDSGTGTIEVMSNHIIIGGEKNFIGENFIVSGLK